MTPAARQITLFAIGSLLSRLMSDAIRFIQCVHSLLHRCETLFSGVASRQLQLDSCKKLAAWTVGAREFARIGSIDSSTCLYKLSHGESWSAAVALTAAGGPYRLLLLDSSRYSCLVNLRACV